MWWPLRKVLVSLVLRKYGLCRKRKLAFMDCECFQNKHCEFRLQIPLQLENLDFLRLLLLKNEQKEDPLPMTTAGMGSNLCGKIAAFWGKNQNCLLYLRSTIHAPFAVSIENT